MLTEFQALRGDDKKSLTQPMMAPCPLFSARVADEVTTSWGTLRARIKNNGTQRGANDLARRD
jgi:hypothetical protein